MGEPRLDHLVCYDIREDKRWAKAFKLLKGYGRPLQYSIFRCHLTLRQAERLRWELERLLLPEDRLLLIGICESCIQRVVERNRPGVWPEPTQPTHAIV